MLSVALQEGRSQCVSSTCLCREGEARGGEGPCWRMWGCAGRLSSSSASRVPSFGVKGGDSATVTGTQGFPCSLWILPHHQELLSPRNQEITFSFLFYFSSWELLFPPSLLGFASLQLLPPDLIKHPPAHTHTHTQPVGVSKVETAGLEEAPAVLLRCVDADCDHPLALSAFPSLDVPSLALGLERSWKAMNEPHSWGGSSWRELDREHRGLERGNITEGGEIKG